MSIIERLLFTSHIVHIKHAKKVAEKLGNKLFTSHIVHIKP
ncbi:hypothetical protein CAAU_2715 [Caloramator australicus RC3]|uniref:Uncharacterized protein n=1 Tax=Caloramator australicus RC3 TaxID=857293 RepID=I7LID8_9CLOT|nr:hypothetical protein CAAU_2715 [Caloramator australicus RC3]